MKLSITKSTGTYADDLQALGTASLVRELTGVPPQIRDTDDCFEISWEGGKPAEQWASPTPGFLFIWRRSKDGPQPQGHVMDYEDEKAKADARKKSRGSAKAKKAVKAGLEETAEVEIAEPNPDYRFAAIIESMRKGWVADKDLYRWICKHQSEALEWVRRKLADPAADNPVSMSNSQILNPSAGKGVHATKTEASSAGSIPPALVDPFAEWMKLRGLQVGLLAYRDGDDFKLMVIEPVDISVEYVYRMLRQELHELNLWQGIRLDIEASLRLLQSLVSHSDAVQGPIRFGRRKPNQVVSGMRQAYFKSLGTAAALMNDALLPLPGWFAVEDRDDVRDYLTITNEPYGPKGGKGGPLNTLRDDRSDDVPILQAYRQWLASGQLPDLLEFHSQFAVHVMSLHGANKYVRQFSAKILDLLMKKGYPEVRDIVTNDGFRSVARAIRNTTIYAAGMKNSNREVRFGLAQKWKQRIKAGDKDFLATLAEFVQEQNWEVVHRLDGRGHVVTETDLNEVVGLVQEHHAELVGMLLLAYGYARAERTATPEGEEAPTAEAVQS